MEVLYHHLSELLPSVDHIKAVAPIVNQMGS